jgi:hypothetical protein
MSHPDRLLVHTHDGAYVFGKGEAGLSEAALVAHYTRSPAGLEVTTNLHTRRRFMDDTPSNVQCARDTQRGIGLGAGLGLGFGIAAVLVVSALAGPLTIGAAAAWIVGGTATGSVGGAVLGNVTSEACQEQRRRRGGE